MTEPAHEAREVVGHYRLIRAIGAGGSARIDLARIERAYGFQRQVVVKRPLEHLRGDPKVATSLQLEARIGGRLRHPNLVAVLDAGVHDGYDYIVLEYVHGAALRTLMETEVGGQVRAIDLAVALGITIDVARGLHEAHELVDEHGSPLGLVHRDVSPGNVLLGMDGSVKLADFGIAKETRVTTLSGSMHGTVTYMAPEQCRGHAFDRRADIFSLGVILYELATRRRLFWADNDVASLHRVLSGQIERPRKVNPELSPALEEIVMTAVAQEPHQRFASARVFAEALEAFAFAEGQLVGARRVARAVEDAIGIRRSPSVVAPEPPAQGSSLVEVIEALPAELEAEPICPTFGPSEEPTLVEGPAEASNARPSAPARGPWRRVLAVGVIAGAIGSALVLGLGSGDDSAPARPIPAPIPSPTGGTVPGSTPTAPVATPAPVAAPAPVPLPVPLPVPPSVPPPIPAPPADAPIVRKHVHRPAPSTAAGSAAGSAALAQPQVETNGSAAKPPPSRVEWKPTMLLPSDTGSGKRTP